MKDFVLITLRVFLVLVAFILFVLLATSPLGYMVYKYDGQNVGDVLHTLDGVVTCASCVLGTLILLSIGFYVLIKITS